MKSNTNLITTNSQIDVKNNRIQNLFRNLQKDPKSVFYSVGNLSKSKLNKATKSVYEKDKVLVNLYNQLEDKIFYQNNNLPLVTPFINKKSNVDHSTLYSIGKPFELLHADIADTRFLAKSAVDPKYCLLLVDLFTSKIYIYPMKNRSLLAKKLKLFYEDINRKRTGRMRLQTDLEFKQNQIKKLNDEFNVDMFHTRVRGGKAFAAEQKIREFKKILLKNKRLEKDRGKRIKPNDLIRKAAQSMNETISLKYQLAPETIEKRSLNPNEGRYFQEIYVFMRLKKIENNQMRNDKYNQKLDRRKRKLRSPLNLDEKVLVSAERLKKKDAPRNLYKASTENMLLFNRNRIFTIYKRAKLNNGTYLYWVEADGKKINGRFLRQELFALNNQFLR